MPLVTPQDIVISVSSEKETTPGTPITNPTWLRLPTIDVRPNLDQTEATSNENRIGGNDEFPTDSRILRWTNEMTVVFEGNVEELDYYLTRFMGVNSRAAVSNGTSNTHDQSTPGWIDPKASGRTPVTFEILIDDGVEKRILTGCIVQRINLPVPELDRIPVEVSIVALDNIDGSGETTPATEQAVNYIYANDATFTTLGTDMIAAKRLRSFTLTLEQDVPREVQFTLGGGFKTAGVPGSGAVPVRAIFGLRRVTASFVALYDANTEIAALRAQTQGAIDAVFKGAAIPASSPAANYELNIHCPKAKYRTGTFGTAGPIRTVDVAAFLLKETAAGPDQNVIFKPTINTVLATTFTFT